MSYVSGYHEWQHRITVAEKDTAAAAKAAVGRPKAAVGRQRAAHRLRLAAAILFKVGFWQYPADLLKKSVHLALGN